LLLINQIVCLGEKVAVLEKCIRRRAVARLMEEEPEFHLSDMLPLPYRAEADWPRFLETLRCADAVD
jgi:hypothetical protein